MPPSIAQPLMRHASFRTTERYYTDLRLHDLEQAVQRLDIRKDEKSTGAMFGDLRSTGTADGPAAASGARHQKCHQSGRQRLQTGAGRCGSESGLDHPSTNDKPRREAGLCDTVLDRAGKRVRRFERPTFTLAT